MIDTQEYEDYRKIAEDAEDLYIHEYSDEETPWENYYHTITDELIED
jgi:hypothetical protein